MTKAEVHAIVKEYELAFHCLRYSEIYYFYSKQKDKAQRFEIFYGEDGKYDRLTGLGDSDQGSDTSCVPGLLSEYIN